MKGNKQKVEFVGMDSFGLKDIFECGQCFRWNPKEDGSYLGIVRNNVIEIKKEKGKIVLNGIGEENFETLGREYFDLGTDYQKIKQKLSKVDEHMRTSISYGEGIRILNQDFWEVLISFILSANNNIPRIKGIIERLSKAYGKEILWKGTSYYTFPLPEELGKAKVEDLRKLGLGFRDKRVYETTKKVLEGEINLEKIKKEKIPKR